jgi:phosphotriesterase-related protein
LKAVTVLGLVPVEALGTTLCHEHILIDLRCWFTRPKDPDLERLADAPLAIENLGAVRKDPNLSNDNLTMLDGNLALKEVMHFKRAGGGTIVDCTTVGIGRNVRALKDISVASGLNIIAGTGFYIDFSHPAFVKTKTKEELADLMISEVRNGVDDTGIQCGIIGEIGTGWPVSPNEQKVLGAAAIAQQATGAPVNVHPYPYAKHAHELLDILTDEGADIRKVVLSHIDVGGFDSEYPSSLARRGCFVEFDTFGAEGDLFYDADSGVIETNDMERIRSISIVIARGYLSSILLSHDICWKIGLKEYGGFGWDHLSKTVAPMFRSLKVTDEQVKTMMVDNPKRMLGFL